MMSLQVPFQNTNTNMLMPIDLQIQLQKQQILFAQQQIALDHKTDEKSYSNRWSRPSLLPGVNIELQNRKLWEQFHAETTEMIITKSGRRMFPSIQLTVNGLNKQDYYYVLMEITPASDRRHKYCGNSGSDDENVKSSNIGGWSFAGPAEPQPPFDRRIFFHPDNPSTGEHWMQNSINFSKLKLTNNVVDHRNNVVLTSMHKYIPMIWIIRCANATNLVDLFSHPASSFTFKETEFIAVTAYQNENITKLKINNNPFAKGFRETGQSRCKRKYQQMGHANGTDDEEGNSFSDSSDSNRSANSLDDLEQKSKIKSEIKNSDDCDDIKPLISIAEDQRSFLKTESDHENEMSLSFHRPWLDSSSHKSMIPMMPIMPSVSSLSTDLSWSYYLRSMQMPFIAQHNLMRYYQYQCPMIQFRKL